VIGQFGERPKLGKLDPSSGGSFPSPRRNLGPLALEGSGVRYTGMNPAISDLGLNLFLPCVGLVRKLNFFTSIGKVYIYDIHYNLVKSERYGAQRQVT
jgi:hypothetical protein